MSIEAMMSYVPIAPLNVLPLSKQIKSDVLPHLLLRTFTKTFRTMCLPSRHGVFLLTYLLTLSRAIPSPPILTPSTLDISDADNSLLNSTLAAVIPITFTIIPSLPLDEPVLDRRYTLILTLHALGDLAIDDFNGQQQAQTWRASSQPVAVDILGPSMVVESALAFRRFAVWGIYKAVHLMVAVDDFRPRNYRLYWQGSLVGFVGFNRGAQGALGIGNGTANETGTAVQQNTFSVSPNSLLNDTTADLGDDDTAFSFQVHGHTIGEPNVYMTLFTGILKAAPYSKTARVEDFFVNSRAFSTYLSFQEREDPGPVGPFFRYEQLIHLCTRLPTWVMSHGDQWTEAEMVVLINGTVVGAGVLRWQHGPGTDGGHVSTS